MQVERLLDVYQQEGGPARLESMAVPLLSWEDYKAIKEEPGADVAALPAGASGAAAAGGRLLPDAGSKGEGAFPTKAEAADSAGGSTGGSTVPGNGGRQADSCDSIATAAVEPPAASSGLQAAGGPAAAAAAAVMDTAQAAATSGGGDDSASESGSVDVDELCQLD